MKNIVRASVIALTLTGSVSYAKIGMTSNANTAKVVMSKTASMPAPMCMPNDPSACGMR